MSSASKVRDRTGRRSQLLRIPPPCRLDRSISRPAAPCNCMGGGRTWFARLSSCCSVVLLFQTFVSGCVGSPVACLAMSACRFQILPYACLTFESPRLLFLGCNLQSLVTSSWPTTSAALDSMARFSSSDPYLASFAVCLLFFCLARALDLLLRFLFASALITGAGFSPDRA